MRRPAETAGISGAVALVVTRLVGVDDPDVFVAVGALVGVLPGLVTLLVANGGVRGAVERLWRGSGR